MMMYWLYGLGLFEGKGDDVLALSHLEVFLC